MILTVAFICRPNLISHLSIKTKLGHSSALLCSPLRKELVDILQELYHLAREQTIFIRERIPLNNSIDNPSHYIACSEIPSKIFEHEEIVSLQILRVSSHVSDMECYNY